MVCVVYSPPNSPLENQFTEHLVHTTTQLRARYQNCGFIIYITGDFNKANTSCLTDDLLRDIVKAPTRGHRCLDLIITSLTSFYDDSITAAPVGMSDHLTVF